MRWWTKSSATKSFDSIDRRQASPLTDGTYIGRQGGILVQEVPDFIMGERVPFFHKPTRSKEAFVVPAFPFRRRGNRTGDAGAPARGRAEPRALDREVRQSRRTAAFADA